MKVTFVSKQMVVTDAIRNYAEKKVAKIEKYFDEPIDVTVTFYLQKTEQTVEVLVNSAGLYLKGMDKSEDIYSSIDLAVDKIERQVIRYKERLKDRKQTDGGRNIAMTVIEATTIEDKEPRVIITKSIDAKLMTVSEAVMHMDLLNKDFFVFRNEFGDLAVVYRRDDGDIGLIEP